ncbi:apoptosis antagonizing transcription factor-domain-containing protein [Kalaharituber pfeilii]|nr:apoptosis antagonizing transcription factor-domain-containing protein [Kalaharituber pfeilii]
MPPAKSKSTSVSKTATTTNRISLKDSLADLLNATTAPKDFDPEDIGDEQYSDDGGDRVSDSSRDEGAGREKRGREHYVAVGKSKLRKKIDEELEEGLLGQKYVGERVRREVFDNNDEDEDEDEEDHDLEPSEGDGEGGSSGPETEGAEKEDEDAFMDGDESEEEGDNDEDDDEEIDSDAAFGESDHEKEFAKFKFKGSRTTNGGLVSKRGARVTGSSGEEEEEGSSDKEGSEQGSEAESGGEGADDGSGEASDHDDEEGDEEEGEDEDDKDESSGADDDNEDNTRDELRKLILKDSSAEAKSSGSNVPASVRSDVEKGKAVRAQQATFDDFLGVRIKLQKALVAVNEMAVIEEDKDKKEEGGDFMKAVNGDIDSGVVGEDMWKEAEQAAVKLWNAIAEMRIVMTAATTNSKKRKTPPTITPDTPTSTITTHMTTLQRNIRPWRGSVLTKWTQQAHANSTDAVLSLLHPLENRLNNSVSSQAGSTTSHLPLHLHNYIHPPTSSDPEKISPYLVSRAHLARACAPTHTARGIISSERIFDDSDFYQLLLRTLVDQRLSSTGAASTSASAAHAAALASRSLKLPGGAKMRRNKDGELVKVDTKASKGRRLRYNVHEKLQDFMVPVGERALGWWEERQVGELFASLLGGEGKRERGEGGEENRMDVEEDGLRIFG